MVESSGNLGSEIIKIAAEVRFQNPHLADRLVVLSKWAYNLEKFKDEVSTILDSIKATLE